MATAAYATTVKIGGTPTTFTGEATTTLVNYTTFQITNTVKRVVDPATAITVYKNGVAQTSTLYTFDYMFGVITFLSTLLISDVVTIDGKYIPTLAVAGAKEYTLEEMSNVVDATPFATGDAWKRKLAILQDAKGTFSDLDVLTTDYDPGAGVASLRAALIAGTPVLLEIRPGGTGSYWRGWVLLENESEKASVDSLLEGSISFQAAPILGTGRPDTAGFSWGT